LNGNFKYKPSGKIGATVSFAALAQNASPFPSILLTSVEKPKQIEFELKK
jgi:hypothetical protein